MKWKLLLCSLTATTLAVAGESDSLLHFLARPIDTAIAEPAPAREIRDSTGITIIDLAYGKGELSDPKRRHYVRYIGRHAGTLVPFSTEFAGNKVFAFIPDSSDVIPGFRYGVRGMRVGGRRIIIVPPHLAYGARGNRRYGIQPNETLMFDIELVKIDP